MHSIQAGRPLRGYTRAVYPIALLSDSRIVSGSLNETIRIWNAETGVQEGELRGHAGSVTSIVISPDGKHIVSSSSDETIRIWDVESMEQVGEPLRIPDTGPVRSVMISQDGKHIVSGHQDGYIRIWNSETGQQVRECYGTRR
jgi:ribosome assembly protein 4